MGVHRVCLVDIVQNVTKIGVFCWFSEGSMGRILQKLAQIEQILIFPINCTNCQLNCIIFSKNNEVSQKLQFYLHAQKSCTLQSSGKTLKIPY